MNGHDSLIAFLRRLSQSRRAETHPGRAIDQERLCAAHTIAARGSEATPATLTTALVGASSTETADSGTSTATAESAETDTRVSLKPFGVSDSEKWCLRTDRESRPLPCSYTKGHKGPCYFRW